MEWRAFLAIALSILVLVVFQWFVPGQKKTGVPLEHAQNSTVKQVARVEEKKTPSEGLGKETVRSGVTEDAHLLAHPHPALDITIETDLFRAVLTEEGGGFKAFYLKKFRKTLEKDAQPINLVKAIPPLLPGLVMVGTPNAKDVPLFKAKSGDVTLTHPGEQKEVVMEARLKDGSILRKTFSFRNGQYWMDLKVEIIGENKGPLFVCLANAPILNSSRYSFQGISFLGPHGLVEEKIDAGEEKRFSGALQWLGIGDKYFMTALVPKRSRIWNVSMKRINEEGLNTAWLTPSADDKGRALELGLYFGPKEIDTLRTHDHGLAQAINFGWFDIVAKPLLYFLKFIYRFTHNYGIAIILLTVLIKLAFWPLSHKSAKAMKTMQKLQPKLQKLKEKYGDDKERLNKELLQLYKTYKVNPMSGCLPMLLQIPVFFALYKVLLQAIELRHAPFLLWINDLSAPDRLMVPGVDLPWIHGIPVLTILMGVSMWWQQKMSPTSLDPTQAQMMQFLPIVFTFMFITFPSGLVLYWLVNNVLSVVQQYYINKFTD